MLKLKKMACVGLSFLMISFSPLSSSAHRHGNGDNNNEFHSVRNSCITLLKAGNIVIKIVGKVATYAASGQILGQVIMPSKARYFTWGGAAVAVLEKAGQIVYAVLISDFCANVGNVTQQQDLNVMVAQTDNNDNNEENIETA